MNVQCTLLLQTSRVCLGIYYFCMFFFLRGTVTVVSAIESDGTKFLAMPIESEMFSSFNHIMMTV